MGEHGAGGDHLFVGSLCQRGQGLVECRLRSWGGGCGVWEGWNLGGAAYVVPRWANLWILRFYSVEVKVGYVH